MSNRLPSCTARDMDRVLKRRGFVVVSQKGSHRYYASPMTGKVVTTVAMHPGDLKRSIVKAILEQTGISEQEFCDCA